MATAPNIARSSSRIHYRPLHPSDAGALCDLIIAARAHDGLSEPTSREEIRHRWFDHPGMRPDEDSVVAVAPDGDLLGVCGAFARDAPVRLARVFLPGAVRPDHRRRGIGRRLLREMEARARTMLLAIPGPVERQIDTETPAGDAGRTTLFQAEGFAASRTFATMRCDLNDGPTDDRARADGTGEDIATAGGATGRSARAGGATGAEARAGVRFETWRPNLDEPTRLAHNDAFRDHWGSEPLGPERWAHFVHANPGFRPDCSWLAIDGETVAGYVLATLTEAPGGRQIGWLGMIGVRRAYRRRGLASLLIRRSLASLQAAGAGSAGLDVDADNPTGAMRLYASLGFVPTERSIIYTKRIDG